MPYTRMTAHARTADEARFDRSSRLDKPGRRPGPDLDRDSLSENPYFVEVDTEALTVELPSLNTHFKRLLDAATVQSYRAGLKGRPVFTVLWRGQAVGTIQLRELGTLRPTLVSNQDV